MAGQEDVRGARMLTQREHQRSWLAPNPNREVNIQDPTAWQKECKRLRDMGIDEEELTTYSRTINSLNGNINNWNDEIVKRLNGIGTCRRTYFSLHKANAGKKSLKKQTNDILNLKKQIGVYQDLIQAAGGRYEKLPVLLVRSVRV